MNTTSATFHVVDIIDLTNAYDTDSDNVEEETVRVSLSP